MKFAKKMGLKAKNISVGWAVAAAVILSTTACAQTTQPVSSGRGAPVGGDLPEVPANPNMAFAVLPQIFTGDKVVGPFKFDAGGFAGPQGADMFTGWNGESPEGIDPLETDLFTTTDFYQDQHLWSDPRYFRCNSTLGIEQQRVASPLSAPTIGDNPPVTAAWGYCDRDYARDHIVSPYEFDTAQAHYEALMAEAESRGGPTEHTYETVPGEWSGRYGSPFMELMAGTWYGGMMYNQIPTILSLLTEEYQKRLVQQTYHQVVTGAAQWPAQFCWPEGFMRRWHFAATTEHSILVTPDLVQIMASQAGNFVTNVHIGREFDMSGEVPRLGADVPRWYGETIGFWDGDALITWTSNIQGWMAHSAFEFSSKMQTIEIYTPVHDVDGNFAGLEHEAVFYDPEALVEPVRIVRNMMKTTGFDQGDPYNHVECIQTIYPIDGLATPMSPGTIIEYEVPDIYGRPWAHNWETYFEDGMSRPEEADIFSFD